MKIRYFEDQVVVLGQSDASHRSQHSCIFESTGLAITTPSELYFKALGDGHDKIITNISFSPFKGEDGPYEVLSLDKVTP